ncbi:MAG: hypothetical protein UZ21_OP11001000008 [Microgenomates bacterium OLB22]|nr:MAG: hypothetical protein UZ21_OP11001000008 [Microgenomates bacterium OLB22]
MTTIGKPPEFIPRSNAFVARVYYKLMDFLRVSDNNIIQSGIYTCDIDGITFVLDFSQKTHRSVCRAKQYEPDTTSVLKEIVEEGDIFIDIGANFGWYTLYMLVNGPPSITVHAFEPFAESYKLLNQTVTINKQQDRCKVYKVAVSDVDGEGMFKNFHGLDNMVNSLYPLADHKYCEESVQLMKLDTLVTENIEIPAVIKCDVEGAELAVLQGSIELLANKVSPPIWFMEANYETSGMAGFFPWQLIEFAQRFNEYQGYFIRDRQVLDLPSLKSLRHGDTLILAVEHIHRARIDKANQANRRTS